MSNYQNATIYFMSGTGNTYRVATWAGEELEKKNTKVKIIPFEKANPVREIVFGEETILGVLLPTHGFTAPWMIIRFILDLPAGKGTHAFISATRGGTKFGNMYMPGFEGTAAYLLALILKLKGYKIRGVIGMDMPLNWTALVPGYSEKTAELIDEEISKIIEEQYQRAIELLIKHKDKLTELATVLLDKEVIFKDNLQKIFGDRPFSKADATFVEVASKEEKSDDNKKGETVTSDEEE